MKVYFGKNFWGSGEDGTEMEEIRLNQSFCGRISQALSLLFMWMRKELPLIFAYVSQMRN